MTPTRYEAFLSYSHKDADLIKGLFDLLRTVGSAFLDKITISPGDKWRAKIDAAISSCSVFLVFWCEHSAKSENVANEIRVALDTEKRIVPVLLDITPLSAELSGFQWIDLSGFLNNHIGVWRPHNKVLPALREMPIEDDLRALDEQLVRYGIPFDNEAAQQADAEDGPSGRR